MRVLITGAGGFVGQILAKALLNDSQGRYEVILTDKFEPQIPMGVQWPEKATTIEADLSVDSSAVVDSNINAVFILHGIMSAGAEDNFDLGMKVNFDSTRDLLNALRWKCPGVRVIYTSANAVFGGPVAQPVNETMRTTPESSYGCAKMMCECLINDYTRRGFITGFSLRLPSIVVRPGKPSAAASSFFSGIIREPLQGLPCVVPIEDRKFAHWISSPRILVKNLMHCLGLPPNALPNYDRVICLPGIPVTVQDMMDSLARIGGKDRLNLVSERSDPKQERILRSWPAVFDHRRALPLGFYRDDNFDQIVWDFQRSLDEENDSYLQVIGSLIT